MSSNNALSDGSEVFSEPHYQDESLLYSTDDARRRHMAPHGIDNAYYEDGSPRSAPQSRFPEEYATLPLSQDLLAPGESSLGRIIVWENGRLCFRGTSLSGSSESGGYAASDSDLDVSDQVRKLCEQYDDSDREEMESSGHSDASWEAMKAILSRLPPTEQSGLPYEYSPHPADKPTSVSKPADSSYHIDPQSVETDIEFQRKIDGAPSNATIPETSLPAKSIDFGVDTVPYARSEGGTNSTAALMTNMPEETRANTGREDWLSVELVEEEEDEWRSVGFSTTAVDTNR